MVTKILAVEGWLARLGQAMFRDDNKLKSNMLSEKLGSLKCPSRLSLWHTHLMFIIACQAITGSLFVFLHPNQLTNRTKVPNAETALKNQES